MKKILFVLIMSALSMSMSAQSVVKTEDGKYSVYCDVMGYNFWGFGKVKVMLDLGQVAEGKGSYESIYTEEGKLMKFNTMIDALNYMGKRGWKVETTYMLSEGMTQKQVIHYMMVKQVTSDEQIREGMITMPEE